MWDDDCFPESNDVSIFPVSLSLVEEGDILAIESKRSTIPAIIHKYQTSQQASVSFPATALIGRVIQKTPIHHFATGKDRKRRFPMNFQLQLAADQAQVTLTVWNSACAKYYEGVQIGMVLCVEKFRVQKNQLTGTLEVSVNSQNPSGLIRQLPFDFSFCESVESEEDSDIQESLIDLRLLKFHSEREWMISVPDGFVFDLAGRITFVGRLERERKEQATFEDGQAVQSTFDPPVSFLQYRWITVRDLLHPNVELVMKVSTCGRGTALQDMEVGQKLLFYNISLSSVWDCFFRKIFLHTISGSQVIPLVSVVENNWASQASTNMIIQALQKDHRATNRTAKPNQSDLQVNNYFYPATASVFLYSSELDALLGLWRQKLIYFR